MPGKAKLLLVVRIVFMVLVVLGIFGYGYLKVRGGTKMSRVTPTGEERGFNIPNVPGMTKESEEKGDCFHKTTFTFAGSAGVIPAIKEPIKGQLVRSGWKLDKEEQDPAGKWILKFTQGDEQLILEFGPGGQGVQFTFDYRWPPCVEWPAG